MQFLKTLFWIILVVALMLFAIANWTMVTINLWGGLQADINLPVLVIGAFLLGFLPPFLLLRARGWAARRRRGEPVPVSNGPAAMTPAEENMRDPAQIQR